jgi:RimJ/RimL family protein N-acetyltransferase
MPGAVFLEGDRVTLRTVEDEDVEVFQRARNEPAIREGLGFTEPTSRSEEAERIGDMDGDDGDAVLAVCRDGAVLGNVSLSVADRHRAYVNYWLLPEHRGEGYATETVELVLAHAFDTLGLERVAAWAVDFNDGSQAVLERLGFTHEGTTRHGRFARGEFHDMLIYGLLADEWRGQS